MQVAMGLLDSKGLPHQPQEKSESCHLSYQGLRHWGPLSHLAVSCSAPSLSHSPPSFPAQTIPLLHPLLLYPFLLIL